MVFVGRAGGACDGFGTDGVTVCTAFGTARDRPVLPALQCRPAWRILSQQKPCRSCRRLRSFDLVFEDQKIAAFGSSYTRFASTFRGEQ
ncbi:hypothetical protein DBR18_08145 [Pseudomonas sp. HMWF021]|nr:hypothetical protein DBR18_08145 [Pseudomonas sp. HMWF021]